MKSKKYSNISNIVSIRFDPERVYEGFTLKELTVFSWKFPFISKIKAWATDYHAWGDPVFDNVEDVIEYKSNCIHSKELRYDEKEGKLFEKPHLHITYVDKTSDKLVFESNEGMNAFYQNHILNSGVELLKIN